MAPLICSAGAFAVPFGTPLKIEGAELLRLPLEGAAHANRVRVRFVTPTETQGIGSAGIRRAVRADSRSCEHAARVVRGWSAGNRFQGDGRARGAGQDDAMRRSRHVEVERSSRATGQTHSLGGFTGVAEYSGELGEFLPYLEIARYTGVGRQTVWGKGEIDYETF